MAAEISKDCIAENNLLTLVLAKYTFKEKYKKWLPYIQYSENDDLFHLSKTNHSLLSSMVAVISLNNCFHIEMYTVHDLHNNLSVHNKP